MSRGGNDVRLILLAHNSQCLSEFYFSIFVISCSSLSEDSVEFSYVVLYLSLTKLCSAASFTRAPHYFTPSFTYLC